MSDLLSYSSLLNTKLLHPSNNRLQGLLSLIPGTTNAVGSIGFCHDPSSSNIPISKGIRRDLRLDAKRIFNAESHPILLLPYRQFLMLVVMAMLFAFMIGLAAHDKPSMM